MFTAVHEIRVRFVSYAPGVLILLQIKGEDFVSFRSFKLKPQIKLCSESNSLLYDFIIATWLLQLNGARYFNSLCSSTFLVVRIKPLRFYLVYKGKRKKKSGF